MMGNDERSTARLTTRKTTTTAREEIRGKKARILEVTRPNQVRPSRCSEYATATGHPWPGSTPCNNPIRIALRYTDIGTHNWNLVRTPSANSCRRARRG